MKLALALLLAAVLIGGGVAVVYLSPEPTYSDADLRAFGYVPYPEPRAIPDFDLADAKGGRFVPERLRGRWSLLFFGYANCPDICPITMSILAGAEQRLLATGDPAFQGVLVSVDPERDTADALAQYVAAFSDRFVGVTGAAADIYAPVSGVVVARNEALEDGPELVNEAPYDDGWFFKVEPADIGELDALLDSDGYRARCESEDNP